jgi:hypothetical protein
MKKFIPIAVVVIMVLGGLGASAFNTNISTKQTTIAKQQTLSMSFSQPAMTEKDGFIEIAMDGTTTQCIQQNKPALPIYVRTIEIPFGSKNIQVTCLPQSIDTIPVAQQVMPARVAPLSKQSTVYIKDESVYSSAAYYPNSWYRTTLGAGRNSNDQVVVFVKIECYPVRYSPATNMIEYTTGFDVMVNYQAPKSSSQPLSTYDMVVIAPKKFESNLQKLIDFKNTKGVKTVFQSVEDIMSQYTGADPPEQVKKFVQYAFDTWGIKYVLIVGGLKSHVYAKDKDTSSSGSKGWWVPVRYVNMPQGDDEGCLSDLYYGCLYDANGTFDSWDSNHDGIYAAWEKGFGIPNDIIDMNPEVYVSRLPVVNTKEIDTLVNKIITYESTGPAAKPWYKNFVGVGGKTFDFYAGKPDGEYLCDLAASYIKNIIPDQNLVTCYTTNRDTGGLTPTKKDISKAVNDGAGFVDFEGHGFPLGWNTIWFDGTYPVNWTGGISIYDFWRFKNGDELPVVIVGGCHNALYNISMIPAMLDKKGASYFCFGYPAPYCFSWDFVLRTRGGAIASTGCTGYGMGYEGNPVSLSGELESNFFWQIGMNNVTNLATAHSMAIQKFIAEENVSQVEAFCITNWALLGDPSLQFGGYSS